VNPAPPDSGIQFVRTDLPGRQRVKAGPETVTSTSFATTVSGKGFFISTVEHLMSALVGMAIDNAIVEIDAEEVPIMDGSAAPFAHLFASAGLKRQSKLRRYMMITQPIAIHEADKHVALYPYDGFRVEYEIEFDHAYIGRQSLGLDLSPKSYLAEIASARTFGFLSELTMLKANGFASGGSLDNAIVLGNYNVINKGGLRYRDEFVRHKILDAVGDLFLTGLPILGRLEAFRSGHGLNNRLARKLMAETGSWRIAEFPSEKEQSFAAEVAVAAWAR
jgi:UDP-3-O-[3-hydroxymyristoyl] N-acetylglucosamine deacetylase